MGTTSSTAASALADAARHINDSRSLEETLDAIARSARDTVPGFDHVGISVTHKDGTIETMAATDPLVNELDALQYDVGEGPCVDSIREEPVVVVHDIRHEQRWPSYIPQAARRGLRSQLGLRLFIDDTTLGGLNLYSTSTQGVDPQAFEVGELFAAHASIALGRAHQEHGLNEALTTRKAIGQAIGIVMERYRIGEDQAFQFLLRASSAGNVKLRDLATQLIGATEEEYRR